MHKDERPSHIFLNVQILFCFVILFFYLLFIYFQIIYRVIYIARYDHIHGFNHILNGLFSWCGLHVPFWFPSPPGLNFMSL